MTGIQSERESEVCEVKCTKTPDIDDVIGHLQIIHTWAEFARELDLQFFTAKHLEDIAQWADDALNLLKEQEAVTVQPHYIDKYGKCFICGVECGNCGNEISATYKFCPYCGRQVKWNG